MSEYDSNFAGWHGEVPARTSGSEPQA